MTTPKFTRERDMEVEREVAKFLDKYLYCSNSFTRKERTDDIDSQLKGSDIILSAPCINIQDAIVDEKALIHYINNHLPTFILELSFINKNREVVDGWFVDEAKSTEYYALQWITARKEYAYITTKDIVYIEYILVSREKIKEYLDAQGMNIAYLKEKALYIRKNKIYGTSEKSYDKDYYFCYTTNLPEMPINIVLKKRVYYQLATYCFIITQNGLYQMKRK